MLHNLCGVLIVGACSIDLKFPPGFKFGAATASYQVEGGWNASDKTENTWDVFTHTRPELISDRSNGDIACDSYNQWREDVKIAVELGLHFYRISLSWTRILPTGLPDKVSEAGSKYYSDLIDALLVNGIEPVITLYHWDLPQRLQDLGGWANPLMVEWFSDYARVVYTLYGDRVKTWVTLNEPIVICDVVYNSGIFAPPIKDPGYANFICVKNLLMAHATAWRIYDEEFKPKYNGKVSLTNQLFWFEAESEESEDTAELARQLWAGIYSHPIFSKEGGWPPSIEKILAENSKREGLVRSKLPVLSKEEIDFIKGTYDYYGLNFYTSRIIWKGKDDDTYEGWPFGDLEEVGAKCGIRKEWKQSVAGWLYSYPQGFRKLFNWIKQQYGDVEIMILENGYPDLPTRDDQERIDYYKTHLEQVLLAIKEDGVNISAYTAWTLIDNFEWMQGYETKFGLYEVDFNDPLRKRTARASARYYASVIKHHSLDVPIPSMKNVNEEL